MPPKTDPLGPRHFPITPDEADGFAQRMEDVHSAVTEFLNASPDADAERRRQREERKRQEAIAADKERRRRRYNTEYFTRYDKDEVIDKLLAEAELDPKAADEAAKRAADAQRRRDLEGLSTFEKFALEQATKQKLAGNAHVKAEEWAEAFAVYSNAIGLEAPDDALNLALRNNRAMVGVKLHRWESAVEDATFVLGVERHNVKALLRRARALLGLHRPSDAIADIEKVQRAEPKNLDAQNLMVDAQREQEEVSWADYTRLDDGDAVERLVHACAELRDATDSFESALAVEVVGDGGVPPAKVAEDADDETVMPTSAMPTLRLKPDDEVDAAIEPVTLALCKVGSMLSDNGLRTVFRIASGLDHLRRLLHGAANAVGIASPDGNLLLAAHQQQQPQQQPPHARLRATAAYGLLVASLMRVYARAIETPTALVLTRDDAATSNLLLDIAASPAALRGVAGGPAATKKGASSDAEAAAQRVVAAPPALGLLAALAADPALAVRVWALLSKTTAINVGGWIDGGNTDVRWLEALRVVEHLLRHDTLRAEVTRAHRWDLTAIAAVNDSKSAVARDTGASLLARLTAVPEWLGPFVAEEGAVADKRRQGLLKVATDKAAAALKGSDTEADAHAFIAEATLAVLHNLSIQPTLRPAVARAVDTAGLPNLLVASIARCIESKDADGRVDTLNVAARVLGVTGKLVLASAQLQQVAAGTAIPSLLAWVAFAPPPHSTLLEREYVETCVENAALTLAALVSQGEAAKASAITLTMQGLEKGLVALLAVVRSGKPRAAGNAAMALSNLPAHVPGIVDEAATLVDFALIFLNRIVSLRGDIDELESAKLKGAPEWTAAMGAKRNIAIALSKYCKHEKVLQQLRDNRGIEILYSALGEQDKKSA